MRKILLIISVISLTLGGIFRYNYINRMCCQQNIIVHDVGQVMRFNDLCIKVQEMTIYNNDELNSSDQFKSLIDHSCADNEMCLVTFNIELHNNTTTMQFIDFSSFFIVIGQWFSNIDLDIFYNLNTDLNNIRLGLSEGITAQIEIPFCIYYTKSNKDLVYRELQTNNEIGLVIGNYPDKHMIKYRNCINL